jgi:hypothetical protein
MYLRLIVLSIVGYFIYRSIKRFLSGSPAKAKVKKSDKPKEENFQKKYADKIEDANFEELD